jgi:ketosteroid isomerase-like protein
MSTRDVVRGYYRAWTSRDLTKARSLLADNLRFEGAIDQFQTGDDFARALGGFVQMLAEVRLLAEFYSTEDAMLLYDCVTPAGTIRTAEYFKVKDGKIQEIKLVVDASELRKMTASRASAADN